MANILTRAANGLMDWVNERAPGMMPAYRKHMSEYYAPKNFNIWYIFGVLSIVVLVNQILTGIFLTMHFKPSAAEAFASVEYIMRDVEWGWLIRYMHSTGASLFFIVVYIHMFRGLMYGSYQKPRELVWILGMLIYLVLMAEAFMGYVLPWGQMSFWGAKVIISLFGAIPVIGNGLTEWIMGDYLPSDATLNRFFALHVIALPLVLLLLVVLHIFALHEVAKRVIAPGTAYVDLDYKQVLALSTVYQGGVVAWVAFWAIYGAGFGAGGRVGKGANEGVYGWGGAAGTVAFVDPKRKLRAVCMAQYMPSNAYPFHENFAKWVLKDLGLPA